ncbi:GNAT family N-acetyltransferase [Vagococcus acidifermentans]|uniref:GNAT family N-acetyltransferase n=1 Tax=Vagococcus acidifermentans TaxID=564710 RepID=A0A430B0T8_9ENTE|nr:GNAT family N-acetyltransferase [Vagococcus acidifermentans]RSU13938.1 GNAT family N-acetyltransferase [Vagococcus acidifermentans]
MTEELMKDIFSLYERVGWTNYTQDPERLAKAFSRSQYLLKRNEAGHVIGVIRWITDFATIAFIQDILVHPAFQRTGIGTELLTQATAIITAYGPVQIELLTDNTEKTHAFYTSFGFSPVTRMNCASYMMDTRNN